MSFLDMVAEDMGLPGARFMPVIGDYMEPTFRHGDIAGVMPFDGWHGDGLYVLDVGGSPLICRCQHIMGKDGCVEYWTDNPSHTPKTMISRGDFLEIAMARVVCVMKWLVDPSRYYSVPRRP